MSACDPGLSCAADVYRAPDGRLVIPNELLTDPEGARVPSDLPRVVDAHVHLFPDRLFDAIWRWFHEHGWPIRYPLYSDALIAFLTERGVTHMMGLHYAHKPDMARGLNAYVAELAARHDAVTGLATFHPADADATDILEEAFAAGLRGVKLHCHVQAFPIDDPRLDDAYRLCAERGMPMVVHAGRAPHSDAYPVDPRTICAAERVDRVLTRHPHLKLCVPHLGADEFEAYARLVRKHDTLWVDTTMAISGYLPTQVEAPLNCFGSRLERVMYGSDFPILPYAWDRELRVLRDAKLPPAALEGVCHRNAEALFDLPTPSDDSAGAPGCGDLTSPG